MLLAELVHETYFVDLIPVIWYAYRERERCRYRYGWTQFRRILVFFVGLEVSKRVYRRPQPAQLTFFPKAQKCLHNFLQVHVIYDITIHNRQTYRYNMCKLFAMHINCFIGFLFADPQPWTGFMTSLNATVVIRGLNLMKHLDCHLWGFKRLQVVLERANWSRAAVPVDELSSSYR